MAVMAVNPVVITLHQGFATEMAAASRPAGNGVVSTLEPTALYILHNVSQADMSRAHG